MLTIHSTKRIAIAIEEATPRNDFDDLVNKMILEKYGEELETKAGFYRLVSKFSEQSYTFSYGIENIGSKALEITLDCNSSRNMIFTEPTGKITKLIEAGLFEFMMHAEAQPGAEEFARGVQCVFKEIY